MQLAVFINKVLLTDLLCSQGVTTTDFTPEARHDAAIPVIWDWDLIGTRLEADQMSQVPRI